MTPTPSERRPPAVSAAEALHHFAEAFAHIEEFSAFVGALRAGIAKAPFLYEVRLQLAAESAEGLFGAGEISLPLAGRPGASDGVLRIAGGASRPLGPEDIHLFSGLAAFFGAMIDHAQRHGRLAENLAILHLILDLCPVGVACIDAAGNVLACNGKARAWLDLEQEPERGPAGRLAELLPDADAGGIYLRVGGKLIFGEMRALASGKAGAAAGELRTFVFSDLGPEQARLLETLQRQTYLCRLSGSPLGFLLLESAGRPGPLLRSLPRIRAGLLSGEYCGPYDALRLGIIFAEADRRTVRARIRELSAAFSPEPLQAGLAFLEPAGGAEDNLLEEALAGRCPLGELMKPSVLLHDDYPAVNAMLEMILAGRYAVTKSSSLEQARSLLRTRLFDLLVTEIDLQEEISGLELARFARHEQPAIRTVFTACSHSARRDEPELRERGDPVLRKPFRLEDVRATVERALEEADEIAADERGSATDGGGSC